jgi:hypothetical protein
MKSHTERLTFNIPARMDFVNITGQVEEIVRKSGVREGPVLINTKRRYGPCGRPRRSRPSKEGPTSRDEPLRRFDERAAEVTDAVGRADEVAPGRVWVLRRDDQEPISVGRSSGA